MPDYNKLVDFLLSRSPAVANNPQAKEWLEVIRNGDAKRGEEIANNICQGYGTTKEDAVKQAESFFSGFKF